MVDCEQILLDDYNNNEFQVEIELLYFSLELNICKGLCFLIWMLYLLDSELFDIVDKISLVHADFV